MRRRRRRFAAPSEPPRGVAPAGTLPRARFPHACAAAVAAMLSLLGRRWGAAPGAAPRVGVPWQRPASRGLADEKAVKNRMRSVNSIQKITKAMKMVAASKLRHDQRRREMGLPFCKTVSQVLSPAMAAGAPVAAGAAGAAGAAAGAAAGTGGENPLLVPVTSDKGLCGSANSKIAAEARNRLKAAPGARVFGVGEKIRAALHMQHAGRFETMLSELNKAPLHFGTACLIADRVAKEAKGRAAYLMYNKFTSVISTETVCEPFPTADAAGAAAAASALSSFSFEPSTPSAWQDLCEFNAACAVFRALFEAAASEQAQRMTAMDSASRNAGDMLNSLTLSYNKARQMKITMELVENISGSNAQEEG